MSLPRGFKADAERRAARLRAELSLAVTDAIGLPDLIAHLGMRLVDAETLVPRSRLEELERIQAFSFSAATFDIGDTKIIVTNPLRSAARLASDVAHELAHVLLEHKLSEVRELDGVPFRTCQPDEEEQATSLGGAILLPRPLLLTAARKGLDPAGIAEQYGVTVEMARFRFNTTGVARQVKSGAF